MSSESLAINDSDPIPVRPPASVGDVCDLVREAVDAGHGIYPVGGRTMLEVGLPPIKPGFALDTTALRDVIDYPARDMTITVGAGMTVAQLRNILAVEQQWLPVDVPQSEQTTLGGAVALNLSGPRRLGYGTLRDYVIGISFVNDSGKEVKAGGRVVKNVAGYDLMKLHIGALGTLGVVTQLTLKVKPKPEQFAAVILGCDHGALNPVLDLLDNTQSRPVVVEILNDSSRLSYDHGRRINSDWLIAVGFEEKATTVNWQTTQLLEELRTAPVRDVIDVRGETADSLWLDFAKLQHHVESRFIIKATVPPSRVAELTASTPKSFIIHGEALNGILWFHTGMIDPPLTALEQQIIALGGNFTIRRCPTDLKRSLPVWGHRPDGWELMRHVKRTLDPHNVFNPGRLFGDI